MKDFLFAMVAVIFAATPKSAARENTAENWVGPFFKKIQPAFHIGTVINILRINVYKFSTRSVHNILDLKKKLPKFY